MSTRLLFAARLYAGRQYDGSLFSGSATSTRPDLRDGGGKRRKKRPLPPIFVERPSEQADRAIREMREARKEQENFWSRAFAEATRKRQEEREAIRIKAAIPDSAVVALLKGAEKSQPEWEDELLLFGEELGLDAEVYV